MLKYFYNLYFQYETRMNTGEDSSTSTFNIGYFSSKKKAEDVVNLYKDKPGFKEHNIENFKIQKTGVNFVTNIECKEEVTLYELSHEFESENGECEWTIFGVFSSEDAANNEKLKQIDKKKYKIHPTGFAVDKWEVNIDLEWKEGFES